MSYDAQARSAAATLARKGAPFVFTKKAVSTRDPVNQTSTGTTKTAQTVYAVILPATESRDMTFDDRALVRTSQRLFYIAGLQSDGSALAFPIEDGVTVVAQGKTWALKGVSVLGPDGQAPVLHIAGATT